MALFEKDTVQTKDSGQYIALLNKEGDLIAFIRPVSKVPAELLVDALSEKGLSVELRESKPDVTVIEL